MRETRTYGLRRQEKENGDRRTAGCVKDTHTQPSSAVLFRLTAPSLDPTHVQVRQKCSVGRTEAHRGKSQNPVAWTAGREETNCLESVDKAIERVVSE